MNITRTALVVTLVVTFTAGAPQAQAGLLDRLRNMFGGASETAGGEGDALAQLTTEQIGEALKEALGTGVGRVVSQLGARDGFNLDPAVHIPLPYELDQVRGALARVGLDGQLNDLETQLNRAAEAATADAGELFLGAIRQMSLNDVREILTGPDDAATRYFRSTMGTELAARMSPVVRDSLQQVGAARLYEETVGRYNELPLVRPVEADLTSHVVGLGMDGIFRYLAVEEALIREEPGARTTQLLRKVFGAAAADAEPGSAP